MGRRNRTFPFAILALPFLAACQQPPGGATGAVQTKPLGTALPENSGDTALGRQALASGDLTVAKTAFGAALRKDPSDAQAALGLAEAHLALQEMQAARQIFQAVADKAPELSARVNQGLGLIALRSGRADQAVGLLGKSVQQDDSLWRAWLGLGQAHDRLKQSSAARRAFAAAERVAPARAPVLNDLGMSYVSQKQPERALEFFERALAMDPGYEIARGNIRIAKAMNGQYEEAISGAPSTQMPDVLNNVGYIAILNKDFDVADRYLRRAIDLSAVYHKAAVANLDLLARMADSAGSPRKTAEAEIAEDTQVVLSPAAADPQPPVTPAPETADIAYDDRGADAVAKAATQQATSAEQLAALTSPTVTPIQAPVAGQAIGTADSATSAERVFKWEQSAPIALERIEPLAITATQVTKPPQQPKDRKFNWATPPEDVAIETADVRPADTPVKAAQPKDRNFRWEDPSDPVPSIQANQFRPEPKPAPAAERPAEPAVRATELRAPLLVDGLGTLEGPKGQVKTVLPPSQLSQNLNRRFNSAARK
ncbi:MAG: tetratricopeptide repeat protein [Pseudomonadota bacterium]